MRILVATDQWSPDVVGGSARVAADTARALARRGHEVVALTPAMPGLPRLSHEVGVEVHRVTRRGRVPQTLADPIDTWIHARRLAPDSFDVALTHQATNSVALAALGIRVATVFHASVVLEMRFERTDAPLARRAALHTLDPVLSALERRSLERARTILVLSRFSAGLVEARQPDLAGRVRIVGGGVEEEFFRTPVEPSNELRARLGIRQGTLLLTARRLEPRMGVDRLIEAVARVRDERVVLAVTGDGSLRRELERLVKRLGLVDRVHLLGRVSERDLRGLYAAADLFVMPTVAYEGFGMSTVEALAQGTPVLGTAIGATPEILADLGPEHLVGSADANALTDGIERLLPLIGPELRERARALARSRHHWDVTVTRWEEAICEAAAVDGRRSTATL